MLTDPQIRDAWLGGATIERLSRLRDTHRKLERLDWPG